MTNNADDRRDDLEERLRLTVEELAREFTSITVAILKILERAGITNEEEYMREIMRATHVVDQEWENQRRNVD